MSKIFVTGASGFVGGATTTALLADGHEVVAMGRSERSLQKITDLGATGVQCDLNTVSSDHLAGCEVVIHAAAKVEQWGDPADFWRINVEGTQRLLQAAQEAGVQRFIHISTEATLFHGQHIRNAAENDLPYATNSPYLYARTKAEAEKIVLANNRADFVTIALRPRLIWGNGDYTILKETADMVKAGRFMWLDGGKAQTSVCHIDNLVHAIRLSLTTGNGGEAYFITDDENVSIRDFLTQYLRTQEIDLPNTSIPAALARAGAFALESIWRLVGIKSEPPITRHVAGLMSSDCTLRIDKARQELGYAPQISVAEGMKTMPKIV